MNLTLSPSMLLSIEECPRCFWLEKVKGIKKPRGIYPSLPGGVDIIVKKYMDAYRDKAKPECLADLDKDLLLFADSAQMKKWRFWKTGPSAIIEGIMISGAVDDCLISEESIISPFDYKTKGSEPTQEFAEKYYTLQLSAYDLMFQNSGYKTSGNGYLLYYWPGILGNTVIMATKIIKIKTDTQRVIEVVKKAKEICEGEIPPMNPECEHCKYINSMIQLDKNNLSGV
jgi:CRISPR/Cas system-associated exonuclease Cas4 (RecB family)